MRSEERESEALSIQEVYEKHIGEFGLAQWRSALLVNITWMVLGIQVYLMSFAEKDPISNGHWECTSEADITCMSIKKLSDIKKVSDAFCQLDHFQWKWTERGSSVVSEFNIACDPYKRELGRSLFFAGQLVGAVAVGYLSDRVGRLIAMYTSVCICGLALTASAFSPSFPLYTIARCISGFGTGGYVVGSFVLVSELMGASIRGKQNFFAQMFFAGGACLMVPLSFFIHSWRNLTLIVALMTGFILATFPFLPNSPQWLLVNGRHDEVYSVLQYIAKTNKRQLPDQGIIQIPDVQTVDQSILDIMKHSKLRLWVIVNMMTWLTACLLYYGVSLALDSMPGAFAVKFLLVASIDFPACIFFLLLIDVVGRKTLYVAGFLLGGVACLLITIVPKNLVLVMAVAGKFGAAGSFDLAFLYTTEIFPTSARNLALGLSSSAARVGGIIAPQVVLAATSLGPQTPFAIFGVFSLFTGLISFALPETLGRAMPDTVQNVDDSIQEQKSRLQQEYWKSQEKEECEQEPLLP